MQEEVATGRFGFVVRPGARRADGLPKADSCNVSSFDTNRYISMAL